MMTAQDEKRAAAEAAAELVEAGMTLGLGTGSTAALFVAALAQRRISVRCVSTSRATAELAAGLGLQVEALDAIGSLDLTVDGADEIAPDLSLIKGAGGALLHEKLVWTSSRRCVVIADSTKVAPYLGGSRLPIEVVAFAHSATAQRIAEALRAFGPTGGLTLRTKDGAPYVTDGGNVIYDAACGRIDDPAALGQALKALTGVVDHGLFIGLADLALVGTSQGVQTVKTSAERSI